MKSSDTLKLLDTIEVSSKSLNPISFMLILVAEFALFRHEKSALKIQGLKIMAEE